MHGSSTENMYLRMLVYKATRIVHLVVDNQVEVLLARMRRNVRIGQLLRHDAV